MTEFQYLDEGSSEAQLRAATAYLFAQTSTGLATTGVLPGPPSGPTAPLRVTQTSTASGSVTVGYGAAVSQTVSVVGVALLVSDTAKTLDVLTANPMGATPRNDLVCFDPATKSIRLIVGTPNASPTDPTLPSGAVPLARIRNAGSATTVPSSAIDDRRVFTSLAGIPDPVSDTGWVNLTVAGGWAAIAGYTPQYRKVGNRVTVRGAVQSTSAAHDTPFVTLPAGARPATNVFLGGVTSGTNGFTATLYATVTGVVGIPTGYYTGTFDNSAVPIVGSFYVD